MTIEDFGVSCWLIAFVCFSYLYIDLWGEDELYKIWEHRMYSLSSNNVRVAMDRAKD